MWAGFAMPGIIWLTLLFLVPFYTVLAIAGGQLNAIFQSPEPVWNPLNWTGANFTAVFHDLVGQGAFVGPIFARTLVYVAIASVLSLLIAYPAAYFVTRFAGRRKVLFLALLIAPFWISYMMRMLAWIDLLQTDGYVEPGPGRPPPGQPAGRLAGRKAGDRHPRTGLRLHPLPDPGPLRRARPHRPAVDRSRARPRPQPDPDLPPGHPPVEPAGHPDRHVDHRAADDG